MISTVGECPCLAPSQSEVSARDLVSRTRRGLAVPDQLRAGTIADLVVVGFAIALVEHAELDALTPAEREVTAMVLGGASNAEVARRRATSRRTVANQLASVYRKLGVTGRRELIARTLRPR